MGVCWPTIIVIISTHSLLSSLHAHRTGSIPVILIPILDLVPGGVQHQAIGAGLLVEGQDVGVPPVHEDGFVGDCFCEGGGGEGVAEGPADLRRGGEGRGVSGSCVGRGI